MNAWDFLTCLPTILLTRLPPLSLAAVVLPPVLFAAYLWLQFLVVRLESENQLDLRQSLGQFSVSWFAELEKSTRGRKKYKSTMDLYCERADLPSPELVPGAAPDLTSDLANCMTRRTEEYLDGLLPPPSPSS
ncbi:hypothetical protein L202_03305 [Cryptococcus amylolentus CBS 6039]|uniref:Uncharacterized protein n=2 Tax=Cryptococcus amylolentus TaxID=104669 RepID=A0A1E3HSE9_9TREE|nr:hypothetical protein L202_03305 [Cryptococcus amylolentus CBS 6039]ODN79293.1 hypothetical protein L202_03305 [Cryptococcus amylolentus CBS 6039]ODO07697.1 hypothetical protein I350_03269 [Cryptococcus amylolentus CBS 6273]